MVPTPLARRLGLLRLAAETGGRVVRPQELEELPAMLPNRSARRTALRLTHSAAINSRNRSGTPFQASRGEKGPRLCCVAEPCADWIDAERLGEPTTNRRATSGPGGWPAPPGGGRTGSETP